MDGPLCPDCNEPVGVGRSTSLDGSGPVLASLMCGCGWHLEWEV